MHTDIKPKRGTDPFSGSRTMKRVYKWMGYVMIFALGWNIWNQGVIAPFFQEKDFKDFIVAYDGDHRTWSGTATIQIDVFDYDVFGASWDGFSLGGVVGPVFAALSLTSPPDTVACVVTANAEVAMCAMRERDEEILSYCPQSLNCDWTLNVPEDEPYAVIIFDADDHVSQGPWDLIDTVIISDGLDDRIAQVEAVTRALISIVSPMTLDRPNWSWVPPGKPIKFNKAERDRRERGMAILDPVRAAEGITLSQSVLYVFTH